MIESASVATDKLPLHRHAFQRLLNGCLLAAALAHFTFLLLFWWMGVHAMVVANVGSLLLYGSAMLLNRHGRYTQAWYLVLSEVVLHALLAVYFVGWGSGFHFYMLLVMPIVVISGLQPTTRKALLVSLLVLLYLAANFLTEQRPAHYPLPTVQLQLLHYVNVLGTILILIFMAALYQRQIRETEAILQHIASTDPLTQLPNRRALSEVLAMSTKPGQSTPVLAFVMCDIDHFKAINDRYGHDQGDQVLQAVSQVLRHGVRKIDHLARWGGEEFLLVLPQARLPEALALAERLRQGVASLALQAEGQPLALSMTFGVSALQQGESPDSAIQRADQALYDGKYAGRNRVQAARESAQTAG